MAPTSSDGMSPGEVCQVCDVGPAVRLIGTVAHCEGCAEAFLEPIRQKVRARYGWVVKGGADDLVQCMRCGAQWQGDATEPCSWCADAYVRNRAQQRQELLNPDWLRRSEGHQRFDDLSPIDQQVWNRTRGQTREPQSIDAWKRELARAVMADLITEQEARSAMSRHA